MEQMNADPSLISNAMTIDVEDYFQVSAFETHIPRESWNSIHCRVENNIERILNLLEEKHIKATFFTLGWIAERYPEMIRRIIDNGHELASHGWGHARVSDLSPAEFKEDIIRSKNLLEDVGGQVVQRLRGSVRPDNGELVYPRILPASEVDTLMVLTFSVHTTVLFPELSHPSDCGNEASADPITVGHGADQVDFQPMIRIA